MERKAQQGLRLPLAQQKRTGIWEYVIGGVVYTFTTAEFEELNALYYKWEFTPNEARAWFKKSEQNVQRAGECLAVVPGGVDGGDVRQLDSVDPFEGQDGARRPSPVESS